WIVGSVIDLKRTRMGQHRLSDSFVGAVAICAAESLQNGVLVEVVTLQLACIHQMGIVASGAPADVRSGAIFGHDKGGGRDAPAVNVERILGAAKTAAETVDLVEILDFGSQSESLVKDLLWTALIPPKHEALVDKAFRRIDIAAVRVSPDEVDRILDGEACCAGLLQHFHQHSLPDFAAPFGDPRESGDRVTVRAQASFQCFSGKRLSALED